MSASRFDGNDKRRKKQLKKKDSTNIVDENIVDETIVDENIVDENIIDGENNEDESILPELNNLLTTNETQIFDIINDTEKINVEHYKDEVLNEKLENEKKIFIKHLQRKIDGIEQKMRYINHKYTDYVNYFKHLNITVIVLSSGLTLFEASTQIIDYKTIDSSFLRVIFQFIPLIVSTSVSLIATFIKFQKYQEKMETLVVTEEKGIIAISKLKKIREQTYFEKKDIESIKELYLTETYEFYNEVNIKISIELDEDDYMRYYRKMSKVDVDIGNTFINKTKNINNIIDEHIEMEKEYVDSDIIKRKTKSTNTDTNVGDNIIIDNMDDISHIMTPHKNHRVRKNNSSCSQRP
tara:strand:- start:144 stop:1199 length:1056 start_codon:yes stop_codon:yes gene_type:complete